MNEHLYNLIDNIEKLLEENKTEELNIILKELHSADIAELFIYFEEDELTKLFRLLDPQIASDVLPEMDDASTDEVLEELSAKELSLIVHKMPSDEATDIIGDLPSEKAEKVLELIEDEDEAEVRTLLKYDEETAGGIMALELAVINQNDTVGEAIEHLREIVEEEKIYYIYVIDDEKKLVGVLPMFHLVITFPETIIKEVMQTEVIKVTTDIDQEEVANIVSKYNLLALPVVDDKGCLLGRVTFDDVMDIIEDEASEDISRMAGTDEEDFTEDSVFRKARMRLPWIITSLFGGILSGSIMSLFKLTLAKVIALAFFIPVITAMGGNIGIQSAAIVVRGLATNEVDIYHIGRLIFKEMRVGMIMGLVCGSTVGLFASVWQYNPILGLAVGLAMLIAITVAATIGTTVPLIFNHFGIDPAIATGPFVTTSNDIVGILIYLGMATLLLHTFQG